MKKWFTKSAECFGNFMKKLDEGGFTGKELILSGVILFLVGFIAGIFSSPKNMTIGCYNGSNLGDNIYGVEKDDDFEE